MRPLPHQIVVSEDTFVKHQSKGKRKEEERKPRSRIPRVIKPRSATMIDGHSDSGTSINDLVAWHSRKDGLLRYMRPTKSSILKGSPCAVRKTTSGKDVRPGAAKQEWKNVW